LGAQCQSRGGSGDETATIKWDSGKKADYTVKKDALVIVFDDTVLISSADAKRVQ
jgi:hypothetical protein